MYKKRYVEWLKFADEVTVNQLKTMDDEEIKDSFYKGLAFGTAGIRGIMGAGDNRLNLYTVKKASKGVSEYLKSIGGKKIAISYDCRNNSREFAFAAAEVFASEGITVFISEELMPTPYLSYAARKTADAGVMITASHNPADYNGYKVYDQEGCQIDEKTATVISGYIAEVNPFEIKTACAKEYFTQGLIRFLPPEVEEDYKKEIVGLVKGGAAGIKVVYSALNGAGYRIVPEILKGLGCEVIGVPLQDLPDGNFPTLPYPNPEKHEALSLSIKKAQEVGADVVIATDPDADRMGMAVRNGEEFVHLSGNEVGALFADFLLERRDKKTEGVPVVIKSIVSTDLIKDIVSAYGGEVIEVLTGFKNIGKEMRALDRDGRMDDFVLGFEESCGYLCGNYARDKDGALAAALACVMTARLKYQGSSLYQKLREIYGKYGEYFHRALSFRYEGSVGEEKMKKVMAALRRNPFTKLCGLSVEFADYLNSNADKLKADILDFRAKGLRVIIRPSGTEPLIKAYLTCACGNESEARLAELTDFIRKTFEEYENL